MTKKRAASSRKAGTRRGTRKTAPARASQGRTVLDVPDDTAGVRSTLDVLRDEAQPIDVRLDALQAAQAATFSVVGFDAVRPNYIATLRRAAQDRDSELRQRALGILAREHDGFAQQMLLDGLRQPQKALVPPEKALQLLSYDAHSGALPVARELARTSRDASVRREALRLLAGDPQSAPVLEAALADRKEAPDIRRMSASALNALNPGRFQRWASSAVLDEKEDADIVTTCLTALSNFGDAKAIGANPSLRKRLDQLQRRAPSKVRRLAKQVLQKSEA
jgi:hypothetical protein